MLWYSVILINRLDNAENEHRDYEKFYSPVESIGGENNLYYRNNKM